MIFLDHAAVAPICGPAAAALRVYAEQSSTSATYETGVYRRAKEVKQAAAKLIGAQGDHEIAFMPNTTTGLAQVANGLDWREGDRVVITDVEFPANRYIWQNLVKRGVELVEVGQEPDGRVDVRKVVKAVNNRTRVVSISHVQYATGFRIDLRPIADEVHAEGGYLCVDAIQSVGVLPVDVGAMGIDFLSADGHKWMLGPEGCGIFYCRQGLAEKLWPTVAGWMCMADFTNYSDYRFELLSDARRFEPGSYNIPGILALGASIDLLLATGIDNIWAKVEALTARLEAGLREKGYKIISPREHEGERSGIVTFEPQESAPSVDAIISQLRKANIALAARTGMLRASPHFYNNKTQVDAVVDALP